MLCGRVKICRNCMCAFLCNYKFKKSQVKKLHQVCLKHTTKVPLSETTGDTILTFENCRLENKN